LVQIPEIDSEHPDNLEIAAELEAGRLSPKFEPLCAKIEHALVAALSTSAVVIAHNVLTMHFNLSLTAALYRLIQRPRPRRFIGWCHDVSRYVNPETGAPQRTGFPWDLLRRPPAAVTFVAVSRRRQAQLAAILNRPPETIRVVPNGVSSEAVLGLSDVGRDLTHTFGLLEADLVLLMPVRLTRAKNVEFALRITTALKALGLTPRLVVSGPPDPHSAGIEAYIDQLRALRRSLDLEREAFFVYEGTPARPEPLTLEMSVVGELYRLCDLVLMPSHSEGFGIPVLESGLADKPIFASAMPAVEAIGAAGVHLIGRDEAPESVAGRIQAWAEADGAQQLRRRVRQGYTWPAIFAREIEPLLVEVAGSPGQEKA
jgi:glycosyltransferase involved in cell wall biosynthesis